MADEDLRRTGKLGKPRELVLGLDPGIASCGFALLDLANHEILEMGSRLFDPPQHPKTGQSLAVERRGFRSSRRNLDRTQERLKRCLELLKRHDVVPDEADKEFFHTKKGDKPPLTLRVQGLDRVLTAREWALVVYSLCKRRGYIPHGESAGDSSGDDGKVLKAINENTKMLEGSGCRTVGEWLSKQERSRNRGGEYDKCITHGQLVSEVQCLFECQRKYGSEFASEKMEKEFLKIFSWEKDRVAFDELTYGLVGSCVYLPEEKRAARCTLSNELVSAHAAFGNVRITGTDGSERPLSKGVIEESINTLFSPAPIKKNKSCKVTYSNLRKKLELSARESFKGVDADEEKNKEPFAPKGWRCLRENLFEQDADTEDADTAKELLKRLADRENISLADDVFEALAYASSERSLRGQLEPLMSFDGASSEHSLSPEEADAICKLPFSSRVLNGYGTRSREALGMLLGAFEDEEVTTLTQAEEASGLLGKRIEGADIERSDKLISYDEWMRATGRTNNNPVVLRAMAQMRKVVNAVCREWGVPHEIHVELARELKVSRKKKSDIEKAQKANRDDNERIAKEIAEYRKCSPDDVKGRLIEKYRLWEEQGGFDAYTHEKIDVEEMLKDEKFVEIDHILPFSRTGDNASCNKVLVLSKTNQKKRERTPYEWMTSDDYPLNYPRWEEFSSRVAEQKIRASKRSRLLEKNLTEKEADFLKRSVTDTAYMSREVCAFLGDCLSFPEDGKKAHVVAVKGQATSWLRRSWGLNFGISGEKDRTDDRHHAIDACVIAACSRSLVQKTAKFSEDRERIQKEKREAALAETMPWEGFSRDVRDCREHVIPTRAVSHKTSGEAFEQTNYSYRETREDGKDVLFATGKEKTAGNAVVSDDGKSARIVGDMAFLRLWHDPEANKGRGKWYADPVYVADMPALEAGTYVPRIAKQGYGRKKWKPVPDTALENPPVIVHFGDAIRVGDAVGRYAGFDISTAQWRVVDLLTGEKIKFPSIVSDLNNKTVPEVVREDVLGHCWREDGGSEKTSPDVGEVL